MLGGCWVLGVQILHQNAVQLCAYLSYIDQQSGVERALIRTQPELRVIIRRYRELEITWRAKT